MMITSWRAASLLTLLAFSPALLGAARSTAADAPGGLSKAPVLRIETGMHTAKIGRIAIHPGAGILASASYDKTLRL
jgi:hypothetical protein